jgi:hypothetical protein
MSALRLSPVLAAWAQAAAALVDTAPRATHPHEQLRDAGDLERLLAACPEPAPDLPRDLDAVRALRPPLRAAFEAAGVDELSAALNPLLARDAAGRRMERAADGWAIVSNAPPTLADWLGSRAALGLAELVLAYGVDRLHLCSADDCLRPVVDVSRNGARRYCSRTCATRVNVRHHRAAVR